MGEKYEDVRAKGFVIKAHLGTEGNVYISTDEELRVTEDSQLDRIEKKVDRILELLEGQGNEHLYVRPLCNGGFRVTSSE